MQNSSFQFSNPFLLNLAFDINKEFNASPDLSTEIPLSFHVDVGRSTDINEAFVTLRLIVGTEDNSTPFYLTAAEGAKFKWSDNSNLNIENLLKCNAPALLLGYLRPIISTLTAFSPFNTYNIPFIDFTK